MPAPALAVVVGGGPAGLMAAQVLLEAGHAVTLYDAMPSVGRKFLLAGKGGLNLTHAEPHAAFVTRFGPRSAILRPWLDAFGPQQVRDWAAALGVQTFVGSSRRVFPTDLKAAPLLRHWLHRLRGLGLRLQMRHRWLGFDPDGALRFDGPAGPVRVEAAGAVLALGGGSWSRLGSDGAWVPMLRTAGAEVAPLQPSNCGFDVAGWSARLRDHHAGAPLKTIGLHWTDADGVAQYRRGECVLTATGLEGSLVYAASADLRRTLQREGRCRIGLDLLPDHAAQRVADEVARPRGSRSLSTHLQSRLGLAGVKLALMHECTDAATRASPAALAAALKSLPVELIAMRPLDEAISSAGGVCFESLDDTLMLRARPGLFCAGEMLDWEAPTGGYLLTACLATGRAAGLGLRDWLAAAAAPRVSGVAPAPD